jgi:glycosyltransferase involved in cell wall biosynthesis
MKVFCYFVEPAQYVLDLTTNVYDKNSIDYCFINSESLVKPSEEMQNIFLDKLPFISRLRILASNYNNHDLIIVNGYNNYPFLLTFILNIFSCNKKYIAIESDTQLMIPHNPLKRFFKWIYLSIIFRNKYLLGFAGGSNSHQELFKYYGMRKNRIFLMPMMVDNLKFYQDNKILPDRFTFLYVGRLVKHKNVENLIKQFNQHFSIDSVVLKIVGGGKEENYLKHKYHSSNVLFLGQLFNDDLISEFKNASCFVFPSKFEPWGLVVNEALSSGLPVITLKSVGANHDMVKSKRTGMIASDMDDFGEKMLEIYNDPELLMEYSTNASEMMKNYWNYNLYNECLQYALRRVEKWV